MADGSVKIDIEADSSKFESELNEIESEAKKGAAGLDDLGDSAEKAAEDVDGLGKSTKKTSEETKEAKTKFQELTEAISRQESELASLSGEYTAAVVNFGKGSAEAKELKAKMQELNSELSANKTKMADAENSSRKLSDALDETSGSLGVAEVAAGTFVADGLANLISGVMEAAASLVGLAESTREFREDMARLETAFTSQGHSAETASQVYKDFYAILGESDRSVEAANHLAELTKNEKELAQWSTIAAGVSAKFGDSLPIEGLTEAA